MSFFSRLSDIISCNVNDLLGSAADPLRAVRQIISEMEEGLAGASRSANAASNSEQRLRSELDEHRAQVESWSAKAREQLIQKHEDQAREALIRKREIEDLLAGLEQQHAAAVATRDQLTTTLRAIGARLAEARRIEQALEAKQPAAHVAGMIGRSAAPTRDPTENRPVPALDPSRADQIEAELDALRRELAEGK